MKISYHALAFTLSLAASLAGVPASQAADAFASPWVQGPNAQSRMINAGGPQSGLYKVGVEVQLAAKNVTYWRSPGEAGVPPTFDFALSKNVSKVAVLYPKPNRIIEAGGITAFAYENDVIFPLQVTPIDPSKTVELALKFNYAACEKICVPLHADLKLALRPVAVSSPFAALIANAVQQVPRVGNAALIKAEPVAGAIKPSWNLSLDHLLADANDLFLELPDGYYADAKKSEHGFLVTFSEFPAKAELGALKIHFTATSKTSAVEWDGSLDAVAAKP